jgi:glycosyltransferase involved in cell wall biosynthesis
VDQPHQYNTFGDGRPMKILTISNLYAPYIVGGYEMLAATVTDELRRRGHQVHIATGHGRNLPNDGFMHGVLDLDLDRTDETFLGGKRPTAFDLINWHLFNWRSYWATRRLIRQLKPDFVSVWGLYLASSSPIFAAQHERIPTSVYLADKWLYYDLKDILAIVQPQNIWHARMLRLARAIVQPVLFANFKSRHLITVSEFVRHFYIRYGFPAEWLTCIHSGVHTERFIFEPASPVADGSVRLLYIGSLWAGKGPHIALQALGKLVRQGYTNWRLDMYGEGTTGFKDWLKSIIAQEGIENHVCIHGFVGQKQVIEAYHTHDIVIFPSIWDEPFASVPMEAMSCGSTIVATTAGGTPEAISDGETGLLVPPNDADALANVLERVITDGELRRRLGTRAAEVARQRFDVGHWVDRLEEYYAQVIQGSVNAQPSERG